MKLENATQGSAAAIEIPDVSKKVFDLHLPPRLWLGPLIALVIWCLPLGIDPHAQKAFSIVAFMICYWVMEPIDHGLTALIGCYLFWAFNVAEFSIAFSGFTKATPWFLFGALIIGEAAARTGLAKRVGFLLMVQVGNSYQRLCLGLIFLSFLLTFFVPSGLGRLAVLAPMAVGIINAFGWNRQSNLAKGLFVVLTYVCGLFDLTLLAGAASILTRGIVAEHTGVQILWSQWLVAFAPLTLLNIFVSFIVGYCLFKPEKEQIPEGGQYFHDALTRMGPWTSAEKKTIGWITVALALWTTDFVHHMNPAIVGLGVALLLCLPQIGVLEAKSVKQINFFLIVFAAGALSMGSVLLKTNAIAVQTEGLGQKLQPLLTDNAFYVPTLYLAAFFLHFGLANRQTLLATSLPVLLPMVAGYGRDITSFALLWSFASGGALFIYQSGIYVMGYSYGYFNVKDFMKFAGAMTIIQGALLFFLVHFYWPLIGLKWIQ